MTGRNALVFLVLAAASCRPSAPRDAAPPAGALVVRRTVAAAPEIERQFGRLVGEWDTRQWRMHESGTWSDEPLLARWTFRYVLDGHAIQDYWIEPPPGSPLSAGQGRQYGTNLRTYDAELDRWYIVWASSDDPRPVTYTATRQADELVMVGDHEGERPSRIVYFDLRADSFRWRLEFETPNGWRTVARIEATRR